MRFGIVTDELSQDPRRAIELALSWGIHDFELRGVHDIRFPRHTDGTLDELIALREEYGIRYTAVSPGFFKCYLDDQPEVDYALGAGLDRTIEFMKACETPLLVCFGFELDRGTDDEAVARLQELADHMAEHGLRAAIENETHCKFNTPERLVRLIQQVDRANMGLNWDLGNLKEGAADGFPAGYEQVKPYIFNVHAKDVALLEDGSTEWRPVGEGICDWAGQMRALERDGLVEHVTIENHCGPLEEVGLQNLRRLQGMLAG